MANRLSPWGLVASFSVLIASLGCVSPRWQAAIDLSEPDWTIRQGQAVWQTTPAAAGIAGDLTVASHPDGRSFVQFIKPPLPLVTAQRSSNSWQVQFQAENKAYSGRGRPPSRILWLQFTDALAGRHADTNWFLARSQEGRWHFENLVTEETLEGFLTTTRLPPTHLVRPGETLHRLARWYGVTVDTFRAANASLGIGWFKPGNTIRLPAPPGQTPKSPP